MDEHKISDQFRDAVGDVPPATFTSDDVAAGAHRANVRRRNTIIAGSAFAVAILAGGVAVGASAWTGHGSDNSAAAASAPSSNTKAGPYEMSTETGQQSKSLVPSGSPSSSGKQGPDGSGKAGPSASSTSQGCDAADGKLAAALAGELPSAPSLDQRRLTSSFTCPDGGRAASLPVRDTHDVPGTLTIMLLPGPGSISPDSPPWARAKWGYKLSQVVTRSGKSLILVSEPFYTDDVPYATDLDGIAQRLAGQF